MLLVYSELDAWLAWPHWDGEEAPQQNLSWDAKSVINIATSSTAWVWSMLSPLPASQRTMLRLGSDLWCLLSLHQYKCSCRWSSLSAARGLGKMGHWGTGPFYTSMSRRKVQQWALHVMRETINGSEWDVRDLVPRPRPPFWEPGNETSSIHSVASQFWLLHKQRGRFLLPTWAWKITCHWSAPVIIWDPQEAIKYYNEGGL